MSGPEVVVVGGRKCGTTSLYWWLRDHPGAFVPDVKEVNHLSGLDSVAPSASDYEALYAPGAGRVRADVSPSYLPFAGRVVERLVERPGWRPTLVAILRDPARRAASDVNYHRKLGVERRDDDRLVADGFATPDDPWGLPSAYLTCSRYVDDLDRLRATGCEVVVLSFEELESDPDVFLARFGRAVGLDPARGPELERRNVSLEPANPVGALALAAARRTGLIERALPGWVRSVGRRLVRPTQTDPGLVEALRDELADEYERAAAGGVPDEVVARWEAR